MSRIHSGRSGSYAPPARTTERAASIHERRKHEDHAQRRNSDDSREEHKGHGAEEAFRVSVSEEQDARGKAPYASGPGMGADPGQDAVAALLLGRTAAPGEKKDHKKRDDSSDDMP